MKKIVIALLLVLILLFSGCTKKTGDVVLTQETSKLSSETIQNYKFKSGEILEFDTHYVSGYGNRKSEITIDGNILSHILHNEGCYWCGAIGYWNHDMSIGNEFGTYHYKVEFMDNVIGIAVTKPDGTVWSTGVRGFSPPYKIGVETSNGDNGISEFDYENFVITKK